MSTHAGLTPSPPYRVFAARAWPRSWTVPLVLALAVVVTRAIWLGDPAADYDEQLYSLIGQRWLDGALPYADLWDRKPAGLFAVFALAHAIGGPSPIAYQVMAMGFTFAGSLLIHTLARPLADRWGALLAGIAYPLMLPMYGSHAGQSEVFFLPLLLGALCLVTANRERLSRGNAMAAMLLCGVALQVKYTVLPVCVMLGLLALVRFRSQGGAWSLLLRKAALFAALGLAPTLFAFGAFALLGAGEAFWWANFGSFFAREAAGRWRPDLPIALLPLALPAALGLWASWRFAPPRDRGLYLNYAAFALACLLIVLLPGTLYLYYLASLVPAAILLGLPLFASPGPVARGTVLALFACYSQFYIGLDHIAKRAEREDAVVRLTAAIAPLVDRKEACLWIFDGPSIFYATAESCVPTRFVYPDHLNNALETHALGVNQTAEVARVLASRPTVIMTASDPLTRQNEQAGALVRQAIARDYDPIAKARLGGRTLLVWRLR